MENGYITPSDAVLTLQSLTITDQSGVIWGINQNGEFVSSIDGVNFELSDPEKFVMHPLKDEFNKGRRRYDALESDLPSYTKDRIYKKDKKTKLPDLSKLQKFKFSNIRTPLIVFSFLILCLIVLYPEIKNKGNDSVKNDVPNQVSNEEEKVLLSYITFSGVQTLNNENFKNYLIFKGLLSEGYTMNEDYEVCRDKCSYKVSLNQNKNNFKFLVDVENLFIKKVRYEKK